MWRDDQSIADLHDDQRSIIIPSKGTAVFGRNSQLALIAQPLNGEKLFVYVSHTRILLRNRRHATAIITVVLNAH